MCLDVNVSTYPWNIEEHGGGGRDRPSSELYDPPWLDAKLLHRRVRRTLPWSTLGPDIDLLAFVVHVVEMRLSMRMGRTKRVAGKCKRTNAARALPIAPGQWSTRSSMTGRDLPAMDLCAAPGIFVLIVIQPTGQNYAVAVTGSLAEISLRHRIIRSMGARGGSRSVHPQKFRQPRRRRWLPLAPPHPGPGQVSGWKEAARQLSNPRPRR